ncbi:VOC family protein [Rossellomorea aquimaris]|uniref:VOC family protein n=1 Tax=Rossellomorea aquimaris TaxID=189382 RepID=UPI001CD19E40|nr:VOC family protein [Rossellomorea aquimaris]MCA1055017.1 VOC family protein [Rossellomorea aquimaris]
MNHHHIGINVRSLEESKEFYKRVFGFKEGFSTVIGVEKILFLQKDGEWLELIEDLDPAPSPSRIHFALEVDDLEGEMERISGEGVQPVEGPIHLPNGWKAVFYEGPDREVIELIMVE